jgi:hypothetical protein
MGMWRRGRFVMVNVVNVDALRGLIGERPIENWLVPSIAIGNLAIQRRQRQLRLHGGLRTRTRSRSISNATMKTIVKLGSLNKKNITSRIRNIGFNA